MEDMRNELNLARERIRELEQRVYELRIESDSFEGKLKNVLAIDWMQILDNWSDVNEEFKARARKVLDGLMPRELKVIKMRYGIDYDHKYKTAEIARDFCVTQARIRQIEVKAKRRLQHPSRRLFFNTAQTALLREKLKFLID